ncbi:MAG: phosphoenolpyruvate--protein phosphotransferase [Alphaproteobacteria bacterium]
MKRKRSPRSSSLSLTLDGLGVSAGIAIGPAYLVEAGAVQAPEYHITKAQIPSELARLDAAVAASRRQLFKLKDKARHLPETAAEEIGFLLDAHLSMLGNSRLLRGTRQRIETKRFNAEAAVVQEITIIAESFGAMEDSYLAARVEEIREVGNRLIRNLTQTPYAVFAHLPEGAILIAEELSPADMALLDPKKVPGIATVLGGAEGHTAIMARALGLSAVLGIAGLQGKVKSADTVIVDGVKGQIIIRPDGETLVRFERLKKKLEVAQAKLARLRTLPAITRDQVEVSLMANLELPREAERARDNGAVGIGLLRTEFMYMNRDDLPGEEEQFQTFRGLIQQMEGRPVTVRTLDVGGDKLAYSLDGIANEAVNPALGLRAIRLSLKVRSLLETQFAAVLRASAFGAVRILLPMIASAAEFMEAKGVLTEVARRLHRAKIPMADPLPPLGIMIEVPSAALSADVLARYADFFAIGTNDLTMFTLAIDRADDQVAYLYNPLHPAVLRLIQFSTEAARRAKLPLSVCGEIAGDPRYTALLLGLGIRELSMTPSNIPRVKQRLRALDVKAAIQRTHQIMEQTDGGRIAALLDDFNEAL